MTGLNFQTQTIINYNSDPDSKKGSKLFEGKKNYKVDGVNRDVLRIKRDFVFVKEGVLSIRKKEGYEAEMCEATIDFTKLLDTLKPSEGKNYCRLDIYLGVEGAEPYIYATPWVQKGIPFWIEFSVGKNATAKSIADDVASIIAKDHIFQHGKDLIELSNDNSGKLTLKGADEFQRFRKVEISMFKSTDDYAEKVAELDAESSNSATAPIFLVKRGKNSFGTYSQIIKDLRLPTAANTQWTHIRQAETPIIGAIYDQYIIEYAAPATNGGMHCVGQRMESHTTHVFWIKHDLKTTWEEALKVIDPDGNTLDAANIKASVDAKISKIEATISEKHPK